MYEGFVFKPEAWQTCLHCYDITSIQFYLSHLKEPITGYHTVYLMAAMTNVPTDNKVHSEIRFLPAIGNSA